MFRSLVRIISQKSVSSQFRHGKRTYTNFSKSTGNKALGLVGVGAAVGLGIYQYMKPTHFSKGIVLTTQCAQQPQPQKSVITQPKSHALYLTIHLKPETNVKEVLKVIGNLDKYIDTISPKDLRDEEDEIDAGVGFGPNFFNKARPGKPAPHPFSFHERKGSNGVMPSTGGDIFIHAKSNNFSKVFELAHTIISELGCAGGKSGGMIEKYEDLYGWVYRNGRDLSGFIDGTENPADDEHRASVAINSDTGGSFVITQKWLHRHNVISREKDATMEGWVGRKRSDSTELKKKAITSHVARMTGGPNFEQKKLFEIVRQSQPFGTLSGENGLFFIGYSRNPEALDYMLDRMVGASSDGLSDDIMRLTECVKSTYWYFPGKDELSRMVSGAL